MNKYEIQDLFLNALNDEMLYEKYKNPKDLEIFVDKILEDACSHYYSSRTVTLDRKTNTVKGISEPQEKTILVRYMLASYMSFVVTDLSYFRVMIEDRNFKTSSTKQQLTNAIAIKELHRQDAEAMARRYYYLND